MGVLTTFFLVDPKDINLEQVEGTAIDWIVRQADLGASGPQDYGLPKDYKVLRCSIDKSWNDWVYVFDEIGWSDPFEVLTEMATKIETPWWVELRIVDNEDQDDLEYLRGWMEDFDSEKTKATCREKETAGYEGESLEESDLLDYVVDNIDGFAQWIVAHHKPGMQLLIATQ